MGTGGRKSKYTTHIEPNLDLIISWREKGDSEEIIADKLHVAYSTLREHKKAYPALSAALNTSKQKLVAKLKRSLWKEALGYEYEETTEFIEGIMDKDGNFTGKKKVKRTKTKKVARPQPNLQMFALCNLAPEEFQRLDKEAVKEIKDEINKNAGVNDKKLDKVLDVLYSDAIKKKESKKKEIKQNDK